MDQAYRSTREMMETMKQNCWGSYLHSCNINACNYPYCTQNSIPPPLPLLLNPLARSSQESDSNAPVNALDTLLWKICFNWQSNTGKGSATHPRAHTHVSSSLSRGWGPRQSFSLTTATPTPPPPTLQLSALWPALFVKKQKQHGCGQATQTELLRWATWKPACQSWLAVKQEVDRNAMEISSKTTAFGEWTPRQTRQASWMRVPQGYTSSPLCFILHTLKMHSHFKSGITVLLP